MKRRFFMALGLLFSGFTTGAGAQTPAACPYSPGFEALRHDLGSKTPALALAALERFGSADENPFACESIRHRFARGQRGVDRCLSRLTVARADGKGPIDVQRRGDYFATADIRTGSVLIAIFRGPKPWIRRKLIWYFR